ncbi:MAG: PDZ domain-containing protein, partial [Gammaproteobacteria bacterium]|nr:PDZ domain-containing protein [Gammaproteobacteria bacterium]
LGEEEGEASTDSSPDRSAADAPPEAGMQLRGRRGAVSEERLIAAGFAADQASEIVGRADAIAMQRLNTQYQAAREGWMDTDRYREAMSALPDVREELTASYGDDAYDRYLYASGRPNRLVVRDVLQDSPAGAAGLQAGDTVLAMADERIYSTRDLMAVASSGSEGETVPLVVQRGDVTFELYVPRGPLGIRGGRGFEAPRTP